MESLINKYICIHNNLFMLIGALKQRTITQGGAVEKRLRTTSLHRNCFMLWEAHHKPTQAGAEATHLWQWK